MTTPSLFLTQSGPWLCQWSLAPGKPAGGVVVVEVAAGVDEEHHPDEVCCRCRPVVHEKVGALRIERTRQPVRVDEVGALSGCVHRRQDPTCGLHCRDSWIPRGKILSRFQIVRDMKAIALRQGALGRRVHLGEPCGVPVVHGRVRRIAPGRARRTGHEAGEITSAQQHHAGNSDGDDHKTARLGADHLPPPYEPVRGSVAGR